MGNGSRWFVPLYEGLVDKKHKRQMGPAIWLYLYVISRAYVAQDDGNLSYSHVDAAQALGMSERTVKRWYSALREHGYVHTRARHRYGLDVQVSNWRPVEKWLEQRQDRTFRGDMRSDTRSDRRSDKSVIPHITIKLKGYSYPTGSSEPKSANMADAFQKLVDQLRQSSNQPAALRKIYNLCFGPPLPDYGYLGKVANKVGGPGRLAELMWQLTTKRPSGDVLAYILAMNKGKETGGDNGSRDNINIKDAIAAFKEGD